MDELLRERRVNLYLFIVGSSLIKVLQAHRYLTMSCVKYERLVCGGYGLFGEFLVIIYIRITPAENAVNVFRWVGDICI